jgi:hypothetical protein
MGLPPAALRFVSRVADADVVLHVKPGKGERHYQYEEVGCVRRARVREGGEGSPGQGGGRGSVEAC